MINRAGSKVAPSEVDEVLLDHPAVAQAVTFAMPHATLGEDVAAAVVLRKDASTTAADIRRFAARYLADFKVPKRVVIMDELPKGPTGKLQRIGLAERIGSDRLAPQRPEEAAAPRTPTQKTLAAIWRELLKLDDIGADADFFEMGGDSLLATELFFRASEVFGVQPALTRFFEIPTIEAQARVITESERAPLSRRLVPIQASGHNPPFFCVAAGTEVAYLFNLGKHLAPDLPFYALRPEVGEGPDGYALERAAEEYIREIRTVQSEGPYFIGGWCAGAAVALEVARGLLSLDQDVAMLAVFAPSIYPSVSHGLSSYWKRVSSLPAGEGLRRIGRTLCALGAEFWRGTARPSTRSGSGNSAQPPAPSAGISSMVQEINRRALTSNVHKAYPGRVTLFLTESEASSAEPVNDPTVVFGKIAGGGVDVHLVSGDHNSVVHEPHVRDLAQQVRSCVDAAITSRSSIAEMRVSA
jgi:thioesterase domain-containing protein/acyl carrier protein